MGTGFPKNAARRSRRPARAPLRRSSTRARGTGTSWRAHPTWAFAADLMAGVASASYPWLGAVVDPILQHLARLEGQDAARIDGDRLAGLRIAPAARMFMIDEKGAEAGNFHFLTVAQRIPDDRKHRFDHFTGFLFGGAYPLVDQIYKIGFSHALRRNDPPPARVRHAYCRNSAPNRIRACSTNAAGMR